MASCTALAAILALSATWRLISWTDTAISSDAEATVLTLAEASSEAWATSEERTEVSSALLVRVWAADWSWVDAEETEPTIAPTDCSNSSAILAIAAFRSAAMRASLAAACSLASLASTTALS